MLKFKLSESEAHKKLELTLNELNQVREELKATEMRFKSHMASNKLTEQALQSRIKDLEQQGHSKDNVHKADRDKIEQLKTQCSIFSQRINDHLLELDEANNQIQLQREQIS